MAKQKRNNQSYKILGGRRPSFFILFYQDYSVSDQKFAQKVRQHNSKMLFENELFVFMIANKEECTVGNIKEYCTDVCCQST